PLGGISVMVAAYFQAVGRAKKALLITLGGIILVKLPVLLLASSLFSLTGIWAAEAASECMLCIISLLMLGGYQKKMATMESLAYSPESGMGDSPLKSAHPSAQQASSCEFAISSRTHLQTQMDQVQGKLDVCLSTSVASASVK